MASLPFRYPARPNGVDLTNGSPGPSRPSNQLPTPSPSEPDGIHQTHLSPNPEQPILRSTNNSNCIDHIYHNGLLLGHWADTLVHVQGQGQPYNMHALLLARSPYLAHLLSTTPPLQPNGNGFLRSIYIPIEHEPEITPQSITLVIGFLYSSNAIGAITPSNARSVLAAGCLLGGTDGLCQYAYEMSRASISIDTIDDWLRFVERGTPREEAGSGAASRTGSPSPGFQGLFLSYASKLREDVLQYLIVDLPTQLQAFSHDASTADAAQSGMETLLNVYTRVPFDIFKKAVESPTFAVGSDHARFNFAKTAIERRKKAGGNAYLSNREESVVLGFGVSGGSGSNVVVTNKVKKRPLWKVSK